MALTPNFEVGTGDGNIDGTQTEAIVFTVAGGRTVSCETATLTGSFATTSPTVSVTPAFKNCHSTLAGVRYASTVTTNGCTFLVHLGATAAEKTYTSTADIVCPAESDIELHVYPEGASHITSKQICGYTVKGQVNLGFLKFLGLTGTNIAVILEIFNITYTRTHGTIPNCGAAEGKATLKGKGLVTGTTTAGAAANVTIVEV